MPDVTVNIRGNASQLENELRGIDLGHRIPKDDSMGIDSSNHQRRSTIPDNNRMIEDVRKEMQQRGVLMAPGSNSMTQVINQYGQSQKGVVNEAITERYNVRREDMRRRMGEEYDDIDKRMGERRTSGLANLGDKANDPFYRTILDQQIDQQTELEYKKVGSKYDEEEEQLNIDERSEKNKAEEELTTAIKELTEYFNRQSESGGNSDSYIGKLRLQQKQLMQERDAAETQEGALDAGKRLSGVNEELRKALSGGGQVQGKPYYDSMLQGSQGLMGMFEGMQSGNIGGTIMGGGSAIAGLSGMGLQAAMRFLGVVGLAAGAAKLAIKESDIYEGMAPLAALRSTSGLKGAEASEYLNGMIPNINIGAGYNIAEFGYTTEEFATEAAKRTKARGTADDWSGETLRQVGLERNLSLTSGSLQEGGKYDRYGVNVTDALMRMVTILDNIEGSGVNMNDFTRVQEKYDIQQQIMGSYMGRADKPNYDVTNQLLAAFSSVKGITQDSRVGSDIQSFQDMIQNPINDRMKILINSTVAGIMPNLVDENGENYSKEDSSRLDLIDRATRNPKNEGKIIQAVIERMVTQYGGMDSKIGYFNLKKLFPNIPPDRLEKYINQFTGGNEAGNYLSGTMNNQGAINEWAATAKNSYATQSTEFMTQWTKGSTDLMNKIDKLISTLLGLAGNPTPNNPLGGGRK